MTKDEKAKRLQLLVKLAAAWDKSFPFEQQSIYLEDLEVISFSQLESICQIARKTFKYFPSIAELLELAGAKPDQMLEVEALNAWDVCGGSSAIGRRAWKIVAPLGYIDNINKVGDFKRRDFIQLYVDFSKEKERERRELTTQESSALLTKIEKDLKCQN